MASLRCESHLFGSRQGYECLAKSSGVSLAEDRALSEFGFGQSSEPGFLDGLATSPTAFARRLPGGRIGVTRVLRGPQDDGGRPTIERRTLVMEPGDYLQVRGALEAFVADNRIWGSPAFERGEPAACNVPAGSAGVASEVSWLIFDAWFSMRQRSNGCVIVGKDDAAARAVLAVAGQVAEADALELSWGIRLLAPIPWADVATISPYGTLTGSRQAFGISTSGCVNAAVRDAQQSSRVRLPSLAMLAAPVVEEHPQDWNGVARSVAMEAPRPVARRSSLGRPMVLAGIVSMALVLGGVVSLVLVLRPRPGQSNIGVASSESVVVPAGAGTTPGTADAAAAPTDPPEAVKVPSAPSLADILPLAPGPGKPAAPPSTDGADASVPPPPPPVAVAPSSDLTPPPGQVVTIAPATPPDPAPAPASVPPAPAAPRVGEGTTAQPAAPTVDDRLSFSKSDLEELERLRKASQRSYPWLLRSYTVLDLKEKLEGARKADKKASSRSRLSTSNVDEALALCDVENTSLESDRVAISEIRQDLSLLADRIKRAAKDGKFLVGPLDPESWPRTVDKRVKGLSASKPTPAERAQLLVDVVGVCLAMDMAFVIQQLDVGTAFEGTRRTSALRQYALDYQQIAKIMGAWRLDVMRNSSGVMDTSFWKSIPRQDKADQSPMTPLEIFDALVAKILACDAGGVPQQADVETQRLISEVKLLLDAHEQLLPGASR